MTAQPSDSSAPSNAELDRRLHAVEEFQHHILPAKIDAVAYGVTALHGELREVSATATRNGQRLDQVEAGLSAVARAQIEHGAALASLAGTVDGHTATLAAHTAALAEHGEMLKAQGLAQAHHTGLLMQHGRALEEILRRLPEPGESS